ncbi:MAG: response regulator transcription factor [Chloroflexota bacterium]
MAMNSQLTVLVVDDDPSITELMRDFLEADGFKVHFASETGTALVILKQEKVDCVLLDVLMPGQNGFELCREIRHTNDVPILFLSALDSDVDKIRGLGLGGDDYIVKSATPAEVVARIKAVLRRYQADKPAPQLLLDFGQLRIDIRAHEVQIKGRPVALTARDYDLLLLLAEHPRQVFTADHLLAHFWGEVGDRHTVAVHIGRLREKIEADPRNPVYLVTVWGVGYRFEGLPQ